MLQTTYIKNSVYNSKILILKKKDYMIVDVLNRPQRRRIGGSIDL